MRRIGAHMPKQAGKIMRCPNCTSDPSMHGSASARRPESGNCHGFSSDRALL
jgi:hypothetical protein